VNLQKIYESGFVARYHTNPQMAWAGQTNGHHQWGVVALLMALFPDEMNLALVWEALHHDAGEMGVCDMSYPAKRKHRGAAEAVAEAEVNERIDMGVPKAVLLPREVEMLKFCDRLESMLFARVRAPWVLSGDGWPKMRLDLLRDAERLGVGLEVERLLACPN
jgi:hypothetical protein